ncbi:MAG: esterase family protein [Maribacter sp.]|nr:esterase family protein [Maribacter sp.]
MIRNKLLNISMISFFLLVQVIGIAQQSKVPIYTSPIINTDRTVVFNIYAPKAENVILLSSIHPQDIPMIKGENGLWSVTIGPVTPEIYHYQFDIDGVITSDLKNQTPYPWLEGKSELIVPGTPALLHELSDVPHGILHDHIYHSRTIGGPNSVRVYTPPNYTPTDDKEYPVLFLLHGFGEKVSFWSDFGKINLIADNLISQNKIIEPIIVMPNGDPVEAEYYKFFASQVDGNAWMEKNMETLNNDLHQDLIPYLRSKYKIKSDKTSMAIAGSSMGGIQAIQIGIKNASEFGWVIGMSTSLNVPPFSLENKEEINSLNLLQLNIGEQDSWGINQSDKVHAWLLENEIDHEYTISKGGHDWDVWRKDMIVLLSQLFR